MSESVTVACVLRSGGPYTPEWVYALRHGIDLHMLPPHRFVCLTDMDVPGVDTLPLEHTWPGWWAKLELFGPALEGHVLALDLDTLPVGNLHMIWAYRGEFAMLRALGQGRTHLISGVMAYRAGPGSEAARLYDLFTFDPGHAINGWRGDGEWIHDHVREPEVLQDLYPGQVCSFKWDALAGPPDGVRLVCGHGVPRFSSPQAGWAHELWRERAA